MLYYIFLYGNLSAYFYTCKEEETWQNLHTMMIEEDIKFVIHVKPKY